METISVSGNIRAVPVIWTIRPILDRHGITPYRLMKECGLSQGPFYRLVEGESKSPNAETLDGVMTALRELTGTELQVSDLLRYEPGSGLDSTSKRRNDR